MEKTDFEILLSLVLYLTRSRGISFENENEVRCMLNHFIVIITVNVFYLNPEV